LLIDISINSKSNGYLIQIIHIAARHTTVFRRQRHRRGCHHTAFLYKHRQWDGLTLTDLPI